MTTRARSPISPARAGKAASAMALLLMLAACGGGGGSSSSSADDVGGSTANSSDTPGASSGGLATASAASTYEGTFRTACVQSDEITFGGANVNLIGEAVITATASDRLAYTLRHTYYDPLDRNCTGTALGTQINRSPDNLIVLDGRVDASFNSTQVQADRVTVTLGAIGGLSAGTVIVINGITYPGDYFLRVETNKDLFYLSPARELYVGNANPGADGYPTGLADSAPDGVRQ